MPKKEFKWTRTKQRELVQLVKNGEGLITDRMKAAAETLGIPYNACFYMYYKVLRNKTGKKRIQRAKTSAPVKVLTPQKGTQLEFKIKSIVVHNNRLIITI